MREGAAGPATRRDHDAMRRRREHRLAASSTSTSTSDRQRPPTMIAGAAILIVVLLALGSAIPVDGLVSVLSSSSLLFLQIARI